jgi:gas vesicle protein
MMSRFSTGIIAGGIIGAVGLTIALSDSRTRRRLARESRRIARKANHIWDVNY